MEVGLMEMVPMVIDMDLAVETRMEIKVEIKMVKDNMVAKVDEKAKAEVVAEAEAMETTTLLTTQLMKDIVLF
jgi:hypothetical protein